MSRPRNLPRLAHTAGRGTSARDSEQVKSLADGWYAATARAAEQAGGDPECLVMLRLNRGALEPVSLRHVDRRARDAWPETR